MVYTKLNFGYIKANGRRWTYGEFLDLSKRFASHIDEVAGTNTPMIITYNSRRINNTQTNVGIDSKLALAIIGENISRMERYVLSEFGEDSWNRSSKAALWVRGPAGGVAGIRCDRVGNPSLFEFFSSILFPQVAEKLKDKFYVAGDEYLLTENFL